MRDDQRSAARSPAIATSADRASIGTAQAWALWAILLPADWPIRKCLQEKSGVVLAGKPISCKRNRSIPTSEVWVELANMLHYHTAGESHGKALVALVDGFPAGVEIREEPIDAELRRRQKGYGRGGRQKLESDHVEILSGLWHGTTIGSPIALLVPQQRLQDRADGGSDLSAAGSRRPERLDQVPRLDPRRPGAGQRPRDDRPRSPPARWPSNCWPISASRSSATWSSIGPIDVAPRPGTLATTASAARPERTLHARPEPRRRDQDADRPDPRSRATRSAASSKSASRAFPSASARTRNGTRSSTAGWPRPSCRFRRSRASRSAWVSRPRGVPAPKSTIRFSYDPALVDTTSLGFVRPTNNAGGLEAGMTNAQPIVLRAAMKPINTLAQPLESVRLETKQPESASYERSDVCAVSAASCVVENVVAFEIARAMVDKFGGDSLAEMQARWKLFHDMAREKMCDSKTNVTTEDYAAGRERRRRSTDGVAQV